MSKDPSVPEAPVGGAENYCPSCDRSYALEVVRCPHDGTVLVRFRSNDPLIGRELGGYTLKERLGEGGMGAVYRGWQHSVGREVAIKVIRNNVSHDRVTAKRFLREAKLASRLSQPSTVVVIDFGQSDDGVLYLAMELLRGRTLLEVLRCDGAMPVERVLRIGVQLCDALDAAHRLGIIHRDLKPSNVMVLDDPPGRDLCKVLDFGLAKSLHGDDSTATHSDHIVGTPAYTPPEVAQGQPADARSDLYSLGVILYEMAAGRRPFVADTVPNMLAQHVSAQPALLPAEVAPVLGNIIMRMLEKDPARRYASAALVREALLAVGERTPRGGEAGAPMRPLMDVESSRLAHAETQDIKLPPPGGWSSEHSMTRTSAPSPPPKSLAIELGSAGAVPVRRSRGRWVIGILLLAAGAGMGVWQWQVRSGGGAGAGAETGPGPGQGAESSPSPSEVARPAAVPDAAVAVAPAPEQVVIRFEATPRADVEVNGQDIGKTPVDFPTSVGSALDVHVTRSGYHGEDRKLTAQRSETVRVTLERERGRPKPTTAASPSPSATVKPSPSPSKFLDPDDN